MALKACWLFPVWKKQITITIPMRTIRMNKFIKVVFILVLAAMNTACFQTLQTLSDINQAVNTVNEVAATVEAVNEISDAVSNNSDQPQKYNSDMH